MQTPPVRRIKKFRTFSKGCAVQFLALSFPFIGAVGGPTGSVVGGVLMLLFVYIGGRMSTDWFCGNCKKPIPGKRTAVCPACGAKFH